MTYVGGGRRVAYYMPWWTRSVARLGPDDLSQVEDAVEKYVRDPTSPSLNKEPIQGSKLNLFSVRASDALRILVNKEKDTEILLEVGQHDPTYRRAKSMRRTVHHELGNLVYVELAGPDATADRAPMPELLIDETKAASAFFDHWKDEELLAAGVAADLIGQVRGVHAYEDFDRFDLEVGLLLLELMGQDFATWSRPVLDPEAEAEQALLAAFDDFGVLAGFSPFLEPAEARRLASAPIEDWMVYLHPAQREVVLRRFNGPARVRGGPGTGKTVVALHRAAELARRLPPSEGAILFTTFVKTLPPVFERLYNRIPGAPSDRVIFMHVDRLANRFLDEQAVAMPLETAVITSTFSSVVARKGAPWQRLLDAGFTRNYLREEIVSVIKGRGLDRVEQYVTDFQRIGRRTPMSREQRQAVWELMEAWDAELASRGSCDFVDRVRRARDLARGLDEPKYRAIIVDEAQDISQIGMEFLHALADPKGDRQRSDALLVVGDAAQRVYPGGFRLLNAGVDVRGRTTILRTSFRTTRQIMEVALAVAGDVEVDDLEEEYRRGEQVVKALRDGPLPSLRMFDDPQAELTHISQRIMELVGDGRDLGDMLVAASANWQVDEIVEHLKQAGVPTVKLDQYDGQTTPFVKVGTFMRSKGLEFKVVLLPFLDDAIFPHKRPPGQSDVERGEARQLGLAQLFVAMTRARDLLIVTAGADVLPEIQRHQHLFEWR
jgi:superfamily I DNA/RNA helicase